MSLTAPETKSEKTSSHFKATVVAAVLLFAAMTNVYLFSRVKQLEVEAHTLQVRMDDEIAQVQESAAYRASQIRHEVAELQQEVKKSQSQVTKTSRSDTRHRVKKLADSVAKQQRDQQEFLLGELRTVSGETDEVRENVDGLRGEVGVVKEEAETTRIRLSDTNAAVRSTRNHLMDLDGEVGHTKADIASLKKLNERKRIAFVLKKSRKMQRVGDLYLRLKNTSPKNNRYSLEIMADDKKVEQKKKHLHEALRFFLPGSADPYEIVVTSVSKTHVTGYISKARFSGVEVAASS
jgi:hypothetical protein